MEIECVRAKRLVRSWSSRDVLARNGKRERVKEKERIVIQDDGRERFCGETFDVCTFRKLTDRLSFLPSAVFFLEFFRFFFSFCSFFSFVSIVQVVYVTNSGRSPFVFF